MLSHEEIDVTIFLQEYYGILWNSCKIFHGILANFHHILAKKTVSQLNVRGPVMSLYFITGYIDFEHLYKVVSLKFLHYKIPIFLF